MVSVPEGQHDSNLARSAWSPQENSPVPAGRLNRSQFSIDDKCAKSIDPERLKNVYSILGHRRHVPPCSQSFPNRSRPRFSPIARRLKNPGEPGDPHPSPTNPSEAALRLLAYTLTSTGRTDTGAKG
jgi:hypothetical protein